LPGRTLSPGESGESVTLLQAGLAKLGHYDSKFEGSYDEATRQALAEFQVASKIIGSESEYGAGWYGAKTRAIFEEQLRAALLATPELPENPTLARETLVAVVPVFNNNLASGDNGGEVGKLQKTLQELGHYTGEITSTYDAATAAAVLAFQLESGVVGSSNELGAGSLGPRTRAALNATIGREKIALLEPAAQG
jgi:peptidoglycan hydrolase-like protein with peptidoglycan-binding domain